MVRASLSAEDHARVSAAVAQAEASTAGEIVTIVAARSDAYHDVALHYAVLAMLAMPALFAFLPAPWIMRAEAALFGWNGAFDRTALMIALFAALVAAFLLVRLLLAAPRLRMSLTPGRTKTRRVHRRAIELFRTGIELKTHGRTGVLIYLSLLEHRAEIVADEAIASQVDGDVWGEAMEALIEQVKDGRPGEGLAAAVAKVGEVLQRTLPPSTSDPNELPDRLIEL